jgi:DNA polymerase-3 subunit epsilon
MKIIIGDTETTAFTPKTGFLVELGLVSLDLDTGEVVTLFDKLFKNPELGWEHRDSWIFKMGYIDINDVRKAEPLSAYTSEIQSILDEHKYFAAWNVDFDLRFIKAEGLIVPNPLPCPMKTSAKWFDLPYKSGRGRGKFASVDEAWIKLFGEDTGYEEIHRGADDAVHEAKIMYELYKQGVIWTDIEFA